MRHLLRRLLQAPLFTGITLLTLAIGIGANTAVFSVIEGVLLKPLPFPQPDRLISLMHKAPGINIPEITMAPGNYFVYREQSRTMQDVGLWTGDSVSVTGLAEPEEVDAIDVTDGVLPILGAQPAVGRAFSRYDDSPGSPKTVMLSYGYWQRRFGGDASAVGRSIRVDGTPREIIGVLPKGFQLGSRQTAMALPFQFDRASLHLGNFSYQSVARLRPGATIEQASAEIERLIPVTYATFPPPPGGSVQMFEDARLGPNLRPLKADVVGDIGGFLWILMATIGIVLVIACANVANLLLVRAEGRQQELAIRTALGAGQGRIAGELLLESGMLGLAGGTLGLGVAYAALRVLIALAPAGLPRLHEIGIDGAVLLFALVVSAVSGVLFGLIPVWKYARPEIAQRIRHGGRTSSGSRERHRARSVLVVSQVALALVLLVGSGLMIRTFQAMRKVNPGFTKPEEALTLTLTIPSASVKEPDQVLRTEQAIQQKLAAIPGVRATAFATAVPLAGQTSFDPIFVEDHPTAEGKLPKIRRFKFAAPGFLATLGNPPIAGRDFTWEDLYNKRPVAILTENLAREYWATPAAAIGKRVRENNAGPWREVVGVVGNERDKGVEFPAETAVYWPVLTAGFWGDDVSVRRTVMFLVRSSRTGSQGFLNEVRQAVWSVAPEVPLASVRTLEEIYSKSMARTSFALTMLATAAGMALLLGVIGIYGVISYAVSQRTKEIGIRMALGAQRGTLTGMFVAHGLRLAAAGVAIGLGAAFALTRWMSSLLFGVAALDPSTYGAVAAGLAAAAVASYLPSRKAAGVDPMEALRGE